MELSDPARPESSPMVAAMRFAVDNHATLTEAAYAISEKVEAELQSISQEIDAQQTGAMMELQRLQADKASADKRLSALAGKPATLESQLQDALHRGDAAAADKAEAGLAQVRAEIEAAGRRCDILAELVRRAEDAVSRERTVAIRQKQNDLLARYRAELAEANETLADAVTASYPDVALAQVALDAAGGRFLRRPEQPRKARQHQPSEDQLRRERLQGLWYDPNQTWAGLPMGGAGYPR
jgi:hypothetical protein